MFTKLQCKSISKEGGLNLSNICDKMGGDVLLVLIGGGGVSLLVFGYIVVFFC